MSGSPQPAVDYAASVEPRRDQRDTSARDALNFVDERNRLWCQLFEPPSSFVLGRQIVRKCESDIGRPIQKRRLSQQRPVELANPALLVGCRCYLGVLEFLETLARALRDFL